MPKTPLKTQFLTIIFFLHILTTLRSQPFSTNLSKKSLGFKKEKLTHLRFYFHDIVNGRHPTAIRLNSAISTNTTLSQFGLVTMMDDPLTVGPKLGSKVVGRAQGIYAAADLKNLSFFMVFSYCFTEGKYNGSSLSILGRNDVFTPMREMAVVGGSGLFRFAKGYVQGKTYNFDSKTGNAIIEYNVYVLHY